MAERAVFTVRLTAPAKRTLDEFCHEHGVTKTSFVEAAILNIPNLPDERREVLLRHARSLDAQNRRRH